MLIDAVSRRAFLAASCGAFASVWLPADPDELRASLAYAARACQAAHPPAWDFFTPAQAADVDAIAAQILPTDDLPGAREAGAVYLTDHSLATWAQPPREAFPSGLARAHRHATRAAARTCPVSAPARPRRSSPSDGV